MATLLVCAYPESGITMVVMDGYGSGETNELHRSHGFLSDFAQKAPELVAEHGVTDVVLYGRPHDYVAKLEEYLAESVPEAKVRICDAHMGF
jgi:hypothetical protein